MRVVLVVRVFDNAPTAYTRELDLPFIPPVGMKLNGGTSTWLWETEKGRLNPEVKEVVYNVDEEAVYCLFVVREHLVNTFWQEIPLNSYELSQFVKGKGVEVLK